MSRWAAVLAGGSGTRFWPLSTPDKPKQFQPLAGDKPLLVQAVNRLDGLIDPRRIMIVTGTGFCERTRDLLPQIPTNNVMGEPRAASTAAALTWASHRARQEDNQASVLSVHADWFVGDDAAFRACADTALSVAELHDTLVTVGIPPTRPDVGYGYILPGDRLDDHARRVAHFVEKPGRSVAERLIKRGALWNCGMFAWTAERFFRETAAHAPEIAPHIEQLEAGSVDQFFARVTPIAVDKSHLERSTRVAVVPGTFPWDDVGTWNALSRVLPLDDQGNVKADTVIFNEATNCVVWPDGERVALYRVSDLIVARANGVTLVTTREGAADLKRLVEGLPVDWQAAS
jgi:mannose-1-phosphate guanylyltransferase